MSLVPTLPLSSKSPTASAMTPITRAPTTTAASTNRTGLASNAPRHPDDAPVAAALRRFERLVGELGGALAEAGEKAVVLFPIGFVSDHLEVIWDLDNEAKETAAEVGLAFARAATAGTHPAFVESIRLLLEERRAGGLPRLGTNCPAHCCFVPPRPPRS